MASLSLTGGKAVVEFASADEHHQQVQAAEKALLDHVAGKDVKEAVSEPPGPPA